MTHPSSRRAVWLALLGLLVILPPAGAQAVAASKERTEVRALAPAPEDFDVATHRQRARAGMSVEERKEAVLRDRAAGALRPAGQAADDHVVRPRRLGPRAARAAHDTAPVTSPADTRSASAS
ncbi:MAG: hypothetical protein M3Z16_11750 [Pseudomonadota bacterium]|nr:hypothetical protein [Pseudomonadota bacterium]